MSEKKAQFAVGRRKTSIARVKIMPGSGKVTINGRKVEEYFPIPRIRNHALAGLELLNATDKYDLLVRIGGGGFTGQAGALRMGIARALEKVDPSCRPSLKKASLFTRDPRMVERKKFGLRKARRGTQFSKR